MARPAADAGWTPERSVAGDRNPWTIIAVISIATFMVVLDTSIANVALAHIAGGMAASYDEATWVITSFLVANAIVVPVSGWLADVLGRKRYYMISVALFTAASLLCGMAPNLAFLVIARVLQGIGGGGLAAVEQSMMVDTFPPSKRGAAFAAYGVVVIVGPILGPSLGGWITDNWSWRWVFLINLPFGLLSLALVSAFVAEPPALVKAREALLKRGLNVDWQGFVLVALFLGCLEVTLDRGQRDDWFSSGMITTFAITSAVALLCFIPWELTRDEPIVRIQLYGQRNFMIANVFMLVMGVIIFGTTQFIPQLLQEVLGYTATDAGLALTLGGAATLMVMPLSGFLTGRVDARYLIGAAFAIQAIALWNMSTLDTQMSFANAATARLIQSVGLPFLFIPITSAAYVGLRPRENNQASALLNVSRNLGGTFGISLVQTMLARRSQVHQSQYVESLNPLNPNYASGIDHMTHVLMNQGLSHAQAAKAAIAQFYQTLGQQMNMLSYIDVFHVLMLVVLAATPLVLLMQKPKAGAGAPAAGH
ncbi:MFS transporter, DHA2 family, multidrug resistance protein [Enhydrobacter aerosaccus]|uniref:MFS transporter, DHA2 family, multidrug resistance protein n=1 Tax=Enhydrobacter aerosaccus TaxID=225324 RepID=A0A1T4NVL9_9HYPH|nr:DHA2 family efflux MFS transporter permease subunit [Enhydrobacter aerosaccus]SJZ83410.1 MFS transporter, DHA2 family, multidrug resistance protein [Enhydrobacter aerosaccus]